MDHLLYCRGLTVDIEDNAGCTPLWLAACFGSVDCVDVLLVHGANPDHRRWCIQYPSVSKLDHCMLMSCLSYCHSKNKGTPRDIAMSEGHTAIVSMMKEEFKCEIRLFSNSVA